MKDLDLQRNSAESATGDPLQHHAPATCTDDKDFAAHFSASDDSYYIDSNCSTPYVSAPSSPGRPFDGGGGGGYFYSAPASPMHFILSKASVISPTEASDTKMSSSGSFEFEFSARYTASCNDSAVLEIGSMSSADELFLNGQIRPMKLSTHLQQPQILAPFMESESEDNATMEGKELDCNGEDVFRRSRDLRLRDKSLRRRARSLSPLRNTTPFDWCGVTVKGEEEKTTSKTEIDGEVDEKNAGEETASNETTPSASASSSRCSSAGRSSKRWVFLKDFLRSKSEGRSNHKFWTNISFSPSKDKKSSASQSTKSAETNPSTDPIPKKSSKDSTPKKHPAPTGKPMNGVGKRRVPLSAHELHYTAKRAQAEEMRKKTFLPYRQGLLGCLGFSSKSYGAMNGIARALNPVSSRINTLTKFSDTDS
ncbi:hypothetical protein V2J09_007844 [Rumex salicifolius]